ncbi:retinoid-inducible serine carboxypeptidase, putative, partial [Ixodes scapularis]
KRVYCLSRLQMSEQQFYVQVHFANLLFVDNPVGAGYSYVTNDGAYARNESQIADDLVALLSVFLTKLPEFQVVPLYIFGESYGGKMAAIFALALNKAVSSGQIRCQLRGVVLGDGWLSPIDSTATWGPYLYTMASSSLCHCKARQTSGVHMALLQALAMGEVTLIVSRLLCQPIDTGHT